MKDKIEEIFNKAKDINLSSQEKANIRARLMQEIESSSKESTKIERNIFAWTSFFYKHTVSVAFVVVLIFAGGTTVLAEKSLPGDTLYPVKTGVNEQVLGWFARGAQSKAEWQLSLAERRLKDIEYLATVPSASLELKKSVREKLEEQTRHVEENADLFARQEEDSQTQLGAEVSLPQNDTARGVSTMMTATFKSAPIEGSLKSTWDMKHRGERIQSIREKIRSIQSNSTINTAIKREKLLRLRGELLLAEKALFESDESFKEGEDTKSEDFLQKAEMRVINAEDQINNESSSNLDTSIDNKDGEVIEQEKESSVGGQDVLGVDDELDRFDDDSIEREKTFHQNW